MLPSPNAQTLLRLSSSLRGEASRPNPELEKVAELMRQIVTASGLSAPALARHLEVAPQTVHRWCNGSTMPRPRQIQKLERWLAPPQEPGQALADAATRHAPEAIRCLGIRFADEVLALEAEARAVWIVKSGTLREEVRGSIGETVLRGLKNGTHFHYLFLESTPAAISFRNLSGWLRREEFTGRMTGYRVGDDHLARAIGLSDAPGAWVGIEYSEAQAARLQRRFDVFFAVGTREYTDAARSHVKNEDGQPCWIELATPQAAHWLSTINETVAELEKLGHWHGVEVVRLPEEPEE